jgi:hypothetical protein
MKKPGSRRDRTTVNQYAGWLFADLMVILSILGLSVTTITVLKTPNSSTLAPVNASVSGIKYRTIAFSQIYTTYNANQVVRDLADFWAAYGGKHSAQPVSVEFNGGTGNSKISIDAARLHALKFGYELQTQLPGFFESTNTSIGSSSTLLSNQVQVIMNFLPG